MIQDEKIIPLVRQVLLILRDNEFTLVQALCFLQTVFHALVEVAPEADRGLFRQYVKGGVNQEELTEAEAAELRDHDFELHNRLPSHLTITLER